MVLKIITTERTYTNLEFEALPECEEHYELLDGRLVKKDMGGDDHARIIRRLTKIYDCFDPDEQFGFMWSEASFNLGEGWIPEPDVAYVIAARIPPCTKKAVPVIPDLAVEVLSPSDLESQPGRDATQNKIHKYWERGVKLIWVINPDDQTVTVYTEKSFSPIILKPEDALEGGEIIPNFKIKVADLFK